MFWMHAYPLRGEVGGGWAQNGTRLSARCQKRGGHCPGQKEVDNGHCPRQKEVDNGHCPRQKEVDNGHCPRQKEVEIVLEEKRWTLS
jgi:hypothetical protein